VGRLRFPNIRNMQRSGNAVFLIAVSIVLTIITGSIAPGFIAPTNILNLLRQAVPLGIIGIGQTMAILTGGVDLSVGSVAILSNVLAANIMGGDDNNNLKAFIICLLVTAMIGVVNGFGITKAGITPFVMTLAMGIIAHGAALVYSKGAAGGAASPMIKFLGTGRAMGVPAANILWLFLAAITVLVLGKTVFGRQIYAIGANRETARMSGVKVDRIVISVYVLSAVSSMIAGLVVTGIVGCGTLEWGIDYRLTSMAAVVMGGTAFAGGKGGYLGTFGAVLSITVLNSLLTILRVSEPVRQIFYGLIILSVLLASSRQTRLSEAS